MHYAPAWRQEFEQSRSGILQCCEGAAVQVEHVGGTAIPGLVSRPIIDIAAEVGPGTDLQAIVEQIEGLNFRRTETPAWCGEAIVLIKPRHGQPTHQLFLVTRGSALVGRMVRVRDRFRSQPSKAVDYEEAKIRFWKACDGDPVQYEVDKRLYFIHIEEQLG